ncbi:hypothetical protein [Pseudomonas fluorescens group sp. PF-69]
MQSFNEACSVLPRMWGTREYGFPGLYLGTGNRCGHDPQALAVDRLDLHVPNGGKWPRLIQAGINRIQAYFNDAAALPPLAHLSKKHNKDGMPRQNRSEAREGHALVLSVIFTYLDLKSLRVGYYTNTGHFVSISFLEIARRCAMTCQVKARDDAGQVIAGKYKEVPTSRFWRTVRDLKQAGAIKVFEQYEEKDAGKRALTAIKSFNKKFLAVIAGWSLSRVEKACKRASQRVGGFLLKAVDAGVENVHQRKVLIKDIQSANVKRELFGEGTAKNRQPVISGARESVEAALRQEHVEHEAKVLASITAALGRPPRGLEQLKMQAQHGYLSYEEFVRRKLGG